MGGWTICSPGSRGEEEFSCSCGPMSFLCFQLPSRWSILVFGLVTTLHKEVLNLTFRVHGNNRLLSVFQPFCLPLSPLALLAPVSFALLEILYPGCRQAAPGSSI